MSQKKNSALLLFASGASVALTAGIGSLATAAAIPSWYVFLKKPSLVPPNFVFGIVWTVLYVLMAGALYIYWEKDTSKGKVGVKVFYLQLFLNALWSIVFFGMHSLLGGGIGILLLLASIIWTIALFSRKSDLAGVLLLPYALWVCFATYLNWSIFLLNK